MRDEVEKLIVDWLKSDNENATYLAHQICVLLGVSKSFCPKCGCDEIFTFHGSSICMNNDCDWQNVC